MRLSAATLTVALLMAAISDAAAQPFTNIVSRTFYGEHVCNDVERLPIFEENWEGFDIWIIGVSLNVQYQGNVEPGGWSMAGLANGLGGDYLDGMLMGAGTKSIMYPPGFAFRFPVGPKERIHIDTHIACSGGGTATIRLTVFYVCPDCPWWGTDKNPKGW